MRGPWRVGALVVATAMVMATPAFAQGAEGTIADLRSALAAERQRISDLEAELTRRTAALADLAKRIDAIVGSKAAPVAPPPVSPPSPPVPPPPRFDWYGDSLFRLSTLHQGYEGCAGCPDRTIGRMRLRFGVQGALAPGLRAVMGLATGELNDPNTVYQTFGGNLSRKVVSWDRGYVAYQPPRASWMEFTAGKFPYPWVRSSLTFDVDFYPEGATERFTFNARPGAALKSLSFQAMQIVANEQSNGPDTLILGGQAIASWRAGRVASRVIATGFDIKKPEHVLRAQLDGSDIGVRNTNLIAGAPGQATYASQFRYANVMVENEVTTPWRAVPVIATVEWHRNLRAASDRDGAGSLRLDVGRPQRRGDWLFGWHVFRVEQEAIMSGFGESDWRAPSNVLQHRIATAVNLHDRVQALFTWYRGRTLDRGAPGALLVPNLPAGRPDPWANRFYFDLLYRY
jgi:hypothetical protein